MKPENIVLLVLILILGTIWITAIGINSSYENKCKLLLNTEFGYQITFEEYVDNYMGCSNYFDGHIIAEYWLGAILLSIVFIGSAIPIYLALKAENSYS